MNKSIKSIVCAAASCGALAAVAGHSLVPYPAKLVEKDGVYVTDDSWEGEVAVSTDASIPSEGYRISVSPDGISIVSSGDAGRFYAMQTLYQLADWQSAEKTVFKCVEVEDAPAYPWRGVHLDECRHFFGKECVKRILDLMAMHKLNRFHWHLTDDQGWRLDVSGYPELVEYGAVRSGSARHGAHPQNDSPGTAKMFNDEKYGPYCYTEADIREIVEYAAARHIQIVPEIELPGHVRAALAAYPQFACFPENVASREPRKAWGIAKDVLCAGNDDAIKFMEDVLDWVCKVFPGDVVHIGGDECPQDRWKTCPKCRKRIEDEGLSGVEDLQPWLTRHFVEFLARRGKRALGWDEYLLGDVPASAIGMTWREGRSGAGHEFVSGPAAAAKGHDIVMTPCSYCYLDFGQGLHLDPFDYIGGRLTLERCYSFDPRAGVPEEAKKHIVGGQGNNWTEYTWNIYDLDWKMWPRMSALSEVFWLGEKKPGFDDFKKRMAIHRRRLLRRHVNCAPLE